MYGEKGRIETISRGGETVIRVPQKSACRIAE